MAIINSVDYEPTKPKKKGLSLTSASAFIIGEMAGGGLLSLSFAVAGTGKNHLNNSIKWYKSY